MVPSSDIASGCRDAEVQWNHCMPITRTQYCRSDGATREITNSLVILLDVSAVHDQDIALRIVRALLHYKEHSNTYVPEEKRQGVAHVSRSTIGAILFVQPKVHVRSRAQ